MPSILLTLTDTRFGKAQPAGYLELKVFIWNMSVNSALTLSELFLDHSTLSVGFNEY